MKITKNSSGFAIFEVITIVAVVAILGFAGWMVYDRQQSKNTANSSQTTANTNQKSDVAQAPEISKAGDLSTAEKALDGTNVESSTEETQLNSDLSSL